MKCSELERHLSELADGELIGARLDEALAHLCVCGDCRRVYDQMLALQGDLSAALSQCDGVPDIVSAVNRRAPARRRFALGRAWAFAAALIAVGVGGYMLVRTSQPPQGTPIVRKMDPERQPRTTQPPHVSPPGSAGSGISPSPQVRRYQAAAKRHRRKLSVPEKTAARWKQPDPVLAEVAEVTIEYSDCPVPPSPVRFGISRPVAPALPAPDDRMRGQVVAVREFDSAGDALGERFYYKQAQPQSDDGAGDTQ